MSTRLARVARLAYAVVAYASFLFALLCTIAWLGDLGTPTSIDAGVSSPPAFAAAIDVCLLGLFALLHSLMARQGFKQRWTRVVPPPLERSTYVLFSSALLLLLFSQWRPLDHMLWDAQAPLARGAAWLVYGAGWSIAILASFAVDHFELLGLSKAACPVQAERQLKTSGLYALVRHPIMLGFLVAFWAAPRMTVGHLLVAASAYARRVPMLLPWRLPATGAAILVLALAPNIAPGAAAQAQANASTSLETLFIFPSVPGAQVQYPSGGNNVGSDDVEAAPVEATSGVFVVGAAGWGPTPPDTCRANTTAQGAGLSTGCGTLLRMDTTSQSATTVTLLDSFDGISGAMPTGTLAYNPSDGFVYGTTKYGGAGTNCPRGCGTIYRINPAPGSTHQTLYSFTGTPDGATPSAGLILASDGNLYGTTTGGGSAPGGPGTLFRWNPAWAAGHSPDVFNLPNTNAFPCAHPNGLTQAGDGHLYASCRSGIAAGGSALTFDPRASTLSALVPGGLPPFPTGRLAQGSDGALYGVTGFSLPGTIFRIDLHQTPPTANTVYSFTGGSDGGMPFGGLLAASDGMLYGTTTAGGNGLDGTIFQFAPGPHAVPGTIHAFARGVDGGVPEAELTEGTDGRLYSTTSQAAGALGAAGTIYRIGKSSQPAWGRQFGDQHVRDIATSVATDGAGRAYVAGVSASDLGGAGTGDLFIARYNGDGSLDASFGGRNGIVKFGGTHDDSLARVALDSAGNIYAAGGTFDGLFGVKNQGDMDVWVASFSPSGIVRWGRQFGTRQQDQALDLTVDARGDVFIAGITGGNLAGPLQGHQDGFVAELTSTLQMHVVQFGAAGADRWARRIAACQRNGTSLVYVAGDDVQSNSAWLSSFDASSITSGPQATRTLPGTSNLVLHAYGLGTDSVCNVYLAGDELQTNLPPPSTGVLDFFYLQKYDQLLSTKVWESDGPTTGLVANRVNTLSVDRADNIYLAGDTSTGLYGQAFQGDPAGEGNTNAWFAAYDPLTGKLRPRSPRQFGASNPANFSTTTALGLSVDPGGIIYIVGATAGALFGSGPDILLSDAFVAQYPATTLFGSRAITTTAITSRPSSTSTFGSPVTFTASVTSGAPGALSGPVTFVSDGQILGVRPLNRGVATVKTTPSQLAAGSHTIVAVYGGDPSFGPSTASAETFVVAPQQPRVSLTSSSNPSSVDQRVTFQATVAGTRPSGPVQFVFGGESSCNTSSAVNANGVARARCVFTTAGSHIVTAVYAGDPNHTGASSPALVEVVQ